MLDIMNRGGEFMWLILLVSIASVAVAGERAYVLWYRYRLDAEQFFAQVMSFLESSKIGRAIELCGTQVEHPVAEVLKEGLLRANDGEKNMERALESAMIKVVPKVSRRIAYLSMFANVATLLGLLGTIVGLIEAFKGVAQADAAVKQDILSKGIAVAMFTTAFGLIAAIPSMIAYSVLQARQNVILSQVQSSATDLLKYFALNKKQPSAPGHTQR